MPDAHEFKRKIDDTGKPIQRKPETKFTELQRFLERIEEEIELSIYEPKDWVAHLSPTKREENRWGRYNSMVGAAVRVWEKYPDCSKPPADNPNPLNGLRTLLIWATEELKKAGTNATLLAALKHPVTCAEVGGIIRKRSDNIAGILKRRNYSVIKSGGKYYCDAEQAGAVWQRWKKHWQKQ